VARSGFEARGTYDGCGLADAAKTSKLQFVAKGLWSLCRRHLWRGRMEHELGRLNVNHALGTDQELRLSFGVHCQLTVAVAQWVWPRDRGPVASLPVGLGGQVFAPRLVFA